ncbi:hypothetical protein F5148DRAFT_1183206 [Russula earlei]|uniref:Uncharacterized protein n=1 Tax=Russula earlei TaxID=71964 RepID=A0ACC0UFH3_9AGAM|nr:hypothetical protein F5148DRAFT_1183206 [Russula earlei]
MRIKHFQLRFWLIQYLALRRVSHVDAAQAVCMLSLDPVESGSIRSKHALHQSAMNAKLPILLMFFQIESKVRERCLRLPPVHGSL